MEEDQSQASNAARPPESCPYCGSFDLQTDNFSNDLMCLTCGALVQENRLVAEVGFAESGGKKTVVGQTVTWGVGSSGVGTSGLRASRDITLQRGKKNIESFGSKLRINNSMQDQAMRIYGLAVDKNFNKV